LPGLSLGPTNIAGEPKQGNQEACAVQFLELVDIEMPDPSSAQFSRELIHGEEGALAKSERKTEEVQGAPSLRLFRLFAG